MIIMELNNCFSNYRCCETTVKATVCSMLLGEKEVIECSAPQINDMVFATWQLVLIIIGEGGILHIMSKHWYDLMKWSQFSHFTAKSLKKNWLICTSFSCDTVGESSSKENYIERRRYPRGATPINVVIFCLWIVLDLWWPQTSRNLLSVLSFLSSGDCLAQWFPPPATVFLSALHQQLFDALIFQGLSQSIQVSSTGMFRYFPLTRLLKSGVFELRCRGAID